MNSVRTHKVYVNSVVTLVTQIAQIILGFFVRKVFIRYLGVEYLGYNSVFVNILQMLNLADLGIGVAITSYLYKPLAQNDNARITAIMGIYKKLYSILGGVVLGVGLIVSIFLNVLIPDATCGIWYLRILFYINLLGTVSTYFLAYKRTLLIADQKSYLTNVADTIVYFVISFLQLLSLIFKPSYIVYLSLNIAKNIISNIAVSIKVNKDYKYINQKPDRELVKEYKPQIVQYVKDVFVSRIGAVVYYSTDNVILSVLRGSLLTGYLSNYTLITGQLNTVVTQVLSSVQATFGNFINTTEDKTQRRKMTDNYFCVNFCIGNFCMICFALLAQPFIKLFFGENMLLTFSTALWLGINLMLTFLIQLPSQVFVIYKLFRYDRPIIIVSAVLNIIISVALVNVMGINGVLIGTFVTSLIYLFSRFYIIARVVYDVKYGYYVKKILCYGLVSTSTFLISYFATRNINGSGVVWFCVKAIMVGLLAILFTAFLLSFCGEFEFLKNKLIPNAVKRFTSKVFIGGACIVSLIVAIISGGYTKEVNFSVAGNKSYIRSDNYKEGVSTGKNIFSLSFDDTILIFEDISSKNYDSIFENATLAWYKDLHSKYGVTVSCFVYYEDGDFNLSDVTERYRDEFEKNSNWLRFGFHTVDKDTNYQTRNNLVSDYEKTVQQLKRIVGSNAIDNVIRLQNFQGTYAEISQLAKLDDESIKGLLTADDMRQSYYLSSKANSYIYAQDELYDEDTGLYFFSTDFRTEYVDNMGSKLNELQKDCWNNQTGDLVVFSHEWALSMENKAKIEKICKYACDKGYRFEFFEDILSK